LKHDYHYKTGPTGTVNQNKGRDISVVTHDGLFHSDEVFSIALLKLFHKNINIVRTRDSEILKEAVDNPEIYVLDTGKVYNPQQLNFDHHQDKMPKELSTISILFYHLFPDYPIDEVMIKLYHRLVSGINTWDQGKIDRNTEDIPLYLPQIISAFNRYGTSEQDHQFIKAIEFAEQIIANEMNTAKELIKAEEIWNNRTILGKETVILDQHCVFWPIVQGQNTKIKYIIQPSGKNWSVVSVDSVKHPLPPAPDDLDPIFEHKDRFIIIFKQLSSAMQYAYNQLEITNTESLTLNYTEK